MPDEARQPSMNIEMVPIHTRRFALGDGRKVIFYHAFLPVQIGIFVFLR